MDTSKKKLSLLSFFAITASMVMTVYEYPTFATSKMNLVFYYSSAVSSGLSL